MPDLGDKGMAERVDTICLSHLTKERHIKAMSELPYNQPDQPSQQDHAPSHPQPTQGQG